MSTTSALPRPVHTRRLPVLAQAGLSLTAAVIFVYRVATELVGDDSPDGSDPSATGIYLGVAASVLALAGAAVSLSATRLAAVPLVVALAMELTILGQQLAPPRLVAALPLIAAIALAATSRASSPAGLRSSATLRSRARQASTVVSLVLMAPIGFFYLTTGLVAPAPDVFGAYALFGLLLALGVLLARRGSWWVVAVPVASAALWLLMLWVGGSLLGWSA